MTAEISPPEIDLARRAEFRLGRVLVRPALRSIEIDGRSELLEPKVMQVLLALYDRAGGFVSRGELLDLCWGGRIVGDDAINRCIAKLRRAGEAIGAFQIETAHKVGYRLKLSGDKVLPSTAPHRRWPVFAASGLLVLLLATAAYGLGRPRLVENGPVAITEIASGPADVAAAHQLRDEITEAFVQEGIGTHAGLLRRGARVEGRTLREGQQIVDRVSLIDPRTSEPIWSGEFRAPAQKPEVAAYEAAWRLTSAIYTLNTALHYGGAKVDPQTLAIHVQARDAVSQSTWKQTTGAAEVFQRAPNWPLARARYAMTLNAQAARGGEDQSPSLRARAEKEARAAIAADPEVAIGYIALATALDGRRWADRERLIDKASALDVEGRSFKTGLLSDLGRMDEALMLGDQLIVKNPANPNTAGIVHRNRYLSGRGGSAMAVIDRYVAMRPADEQLKRTKLMISLLYGDPDEALAILNAPDRRPVLQTDATYAAYAAAATARKSGAPTDRTRAIAALLDLGLKGEMPREHAMLLLNGLGDREGAMRVGLAFAADRSESDYALDFHPGFLFAKDLAPLREDPRFATIVETLGLAGYWQSTGRWPDFCRTEPRSVCGRIKTASR